MSTTIAITGELGIDELAGPGATCDFDGAGVYRYHVPGRSTRTVRVHLAGARHEVQIADVGARWPAIFGAARRVARG